MEPKKFKQANVTFGEGQPEHKPLPALRLDSGEVVTCWTLTEEEKQKVMETGEIWLSQQTFNAPLQPVWVGVDKPFVDVAEQFEELETIIKDPSNENRRKEAIIEWLEGKGATMDEILFDTVATFRKYTGLNVEDAWKEAMVRFSEKGASILNTRDSITVPEIDIEKVEGEK